MALDLVLQKEKKVKSQAQMPINNIPAETRTSIAPLESWIKK